MNERILKVLTGMVLGSLLVVSCSRPAEQVSSTETAAKSEPESPAVAPAPAEPAESPKPAPPAQPQLRKSPAKTDLAPAPAPPVAAAPAPVPAPSAVAPAPVPVANVPVPAPVPVAPPPPPAPVIPATRDVTIPSGTVLSVRMVDSVDSKTDQVGQTYKASMDAPLVLDGQTIISKGGEVTLKLTKVASAGNIKGASEVNLQLDKLYVNKKAYTVTSNTFQSVGKSEGTKTAKQTGIGAGIGAVIGAIAGGGKGAAIGAGVGGGAGAATAAITKGEQVRIASEEKLDFRLEEPLTVTVPNPAARSAQ
jgi:YmgG-like glycine-zipper protein